MSPAILLTLAVAQAPLVDSGGTAFLHFAIGRPLTAVAEQLLYCMPGRDYAVLGSGYRVTTDDALFRSPHEHEDSGAVLAALDSVRVCSGRIPNARAGVLVAVLDSGIVKLGVTWFDSLSRPNADSLHQLLVVRFGPANETRAGGWTWELDSIAIDLTRESWWLPGAPQLYVTHARGCERYEAMVHRREPARDWVGDRTRYCWVRAPLR